MQRYIDRQVAGELQYSLDHNPVTVLAGPRGCGKTTLVRHLLEGRNDTVFLDLELPLDLIKLDNPELFVSGHAEKLVCINHVQRKPDLSPLLRIIVDRDRNPGRFLLLSSASCDFFRRYGEALAARIHHVELTPFAWKELVAGAGSDGWDFTRHWLCGGFPQAFLPDSEAESLAWRRDMIRDCLGRIIPPFRRDMLPVVERLFRTAAHYQGDMRFNITIDRSTGMYGQRACKYLGLLEQTYMIRLLQPIRIRFKKYLIKTPKFYVRDSGLLHTLLEIGNMEELYGHPLLGASWEGWCLEQIIRRLPKWQPSFYRTHVPKDGRINLVLTNENNRLAFDFKISPPPHLSKESTNALAVLQPERTWIVCPSTDPAYPLQDGVRITGIEEVLEELEAFL
ncbi:MAG: AAA family ATPase [Syntrophales bacterium]|nr:AAA family ATPase [Syntrophales bacterium]